MTMSGIKLMFLLNLPQNLGPIYLNISFDMKEISKGLLRVLRPIGLVMLIGVVAGIGEISAQDGEKLFKANCSACHKINGNMTGPALAGVEERWEGKKELLYKWIKNPAEVKEMGDPYVKDLLAEWEPKSGLMNAQAVTNEEIDAILAYIANPPVKEVPKDQVSAEPVPVADPTLNPIWLFIIAFILLILIVSLWGVKRSLADLSNAMRENEGLEPIPNLGFGDRARVWLWNNKVFVSIIGILVVVYLVVLGYEGLMGIGVYQGYTPEQPIKFDHTLHAGQNEVACVYCHHSATKSKHAGIPSANICMNCHKAINEGRTEEGTKEIQKIYAAIGWSPEEQAYTGEQKPIKWVKVHNLPDHAYFNHAQHYVVGEIECQECHGEMQEDYTVAGQYAPLTMGWCINCHNETEVVMADNGYYDEIHERLKEHGKEELKQYLEDGSITAKELGGWECAKCHY